MNKETFQMGMSLLMRVFPNIKMDPEIYWFMLSDVDDEAFIQSIRKVSLSNKDIYPGTNILALIKDNAISDKKYLTAPEAWKLACECCGGAKVSTKGLPDLVKKTVDAIGAWEIRTTENAAATRAHFFKSYEKIMERERKDELTECKGLDKLIEGLSNKLSLPETGMK